MKRVPHLLSAAHLILVKENTVLLQRRFQTGWMDGKYSLPAGHIEDGESATSSLLREVEEEIGLSLNLEDIQICHVMHRKAENDIQYIDYFFSCSNWQGTPKICEPEKCDKLLWFPIDTLPTNMVPYIQKALECFSEKTFFSEFGWNTSAHH